MVKRGVALVLSLAVTTVAFGQVVVQLVPEHDGPYANRETVLVEVFLSQAPGNVNRSLRMVQFDFSESTVTSVFGDTRSGDLLFWEFESTLLCDPPVSTGSCGVDHYIDGQPSQLPPGDDIFAIAFGSAGELGENTDKQLVLPGDGAPLKVGVFRLTMFPENSRSVLDVLNVNNDHVANPDFGSQVRWGFGTNINDEPLTNWRSDDGSGNLTGTALEFCIGNPNPPCIPPEPRLMESTPLCDVSLTRPSNSVIKLTFDMPIPDPVLPGQIEIREITDGGVQGADISNLFNFTVEPGNILKISEDGTTGFGNEKWYAIINNGTWSNVANFEVDYRVVFGDANNTGRTSFTDLAAINANLRNPTTDDDPYDINASGFVSFTDLAAANSFIGSEAQSPKPTGHSCFAD